MNQNEMLDQLTEEDGLKLLIGEWKANGNKWMYHSGSPARIRFTTENGRLFDTLCKALAARGNMTIEQIRFACSPNAIELANV